MGILRFVLAAAVVCAHAGHTPGLFVMFGGEAVRAFFVISGFYMTLILDSKYGSKSRWLFYSNRALRIFPMYYAVLLLCVMLYGAAVLKTGHPVDRLLYWVQAAHLGDWPQLALLALAHITLVGIESTSYFSFSPEHGFALGVDLPNTVEVWRFCFLPQTWTVAIELCFYLVAPWLVRLRKRVLIALILANAVAFYLVEFFCTNVLARTVSSHFFPFTLMFFLAGILAYRLFHDRPTHGPGSLAVNWTIVGLLVLACALLGTVRGGLPYQIAQAGFVFLLFLGVPFLFEQTKNWMWDRLIGELSYPMYLCHLPVKWMLMAAQGHADRESNHMPVYILLPATVVMSALLVRFIDYPVDRFRQRRAAGHKSEAFPHAEPVRAAGQPKLN